MMKYRMRKIEKKDNEQMAKIIREVMTEYGACGHGFSIQDKEVDTMYENYQDRASYYVVEIIQDKGEEKILGGAGIAQLLGADEHICELKKMYFLKALRGLGYGQKILDRCIKDAKNFGYTSMYLETLTQMKEAMAFYQKNGFIKIDKQMGNTGHFSCNAFYLKNI